MSDNIIPKITEYTYKQGDIVKYSLNIPGGKLEGTGRIVGVATAWQPIIGCIYMIFNPEEFPNKVYPYSTIPMPESALEYLYNIPDKYFLIAKSEDVFELDEVTDFDNDYKALKYALNNISNNNKVTYYTAQILNQNNHLRTNT